jgi:hypothetical protein
VCCSTICLPAPRIRGMHYAPARSTIFNSHSLRATLILRTASAKTAPGEKIHARKSTGGGGGELLNKFWPNFLQFIPSALQLCCETSPFLSLVGALLRSHTHTHTRIYFTLEGERSLRGGRLSVYVCHWHLSYCTKIYTRHAA